MKNKTVSFILTAIIILVWFGLGIFNKISGAEFAIGYIAFILGAEMIMISNKNDAKRGN